MTYSRGMTYVLVLVGIAVVGSERGYLHLMNMNRNSNTTGKRYADD